MKDLRRWRIDLWTEKMVEQKSPKVLCWLSGRLPHQGAAGGVPSAVCADSEITKIIEATYLRHPLTTPFAIIGVHLGSISNPNPRSRCLARGIDAEALRLNGC